MGKRKVRTAKSSLPPPENDENERDRDQEEEEEGGGGGRFFACYLLTSLCPRFKGHTYIGFTVNPRRRIRQHNGEIGCGAWRTKKKRPWEMVLCIYGFPTNVAALQFEWAWQHPVESLAVRKAATSFKSVNGLANKIKLAYTMLTLPSWQSLNLTVNFFSTKYQIHACGCPTLPRQMRSKVGSMDELPCYNENAVLDDDDWDGDEKCNANDSLQEQTRDISTNATEQVHTSGSSEEYVYYQPTREVSTGVTEQVHSSGSSEEYFHPQMSQKYGSRGSPGLPGENLAEASNSSPVREKYPGWSAMGYDTPAKTFSSYVSSYDAKDFQTSTLEDHFSTEFNHSVKRSSAALFAEKDEVSIKTPPGVDGRQSEVIDLITPSPCYTNKLANKKMKTNSSTEVIDLTTSPMSV